MFSLRQPPFDTFDGSGPEDITAALDEAGLNWEVLSKPAYFLDNWEEIERAENGEFDDEEAEYPGLIVEPVEGWFVNVRSDTNAPLGIVSKRYATFHNVQAFGFLAHVFDSEMHYVSAGDFGGGKRVWVVMKLPDWIEIGGDKIGQYAFVHTSHDGKHSVTAATTPYRWLTHTILPMDLRRLKNKEHRANRVIHLRHTGDMESKIAELEAERVLNFTKNYYTKFQALGNKLASKKPTKGDVAAFLEGLIPIPEDQGDRAQANAYQNRVSVENIFRGKGPDGDSQGNAPGSWWALYNAAVEYSQWVRPERKKGGRFQRTIDDPDGFVSAAFELALGGAGL